MRILLLGATGRTGKKIVEHALAGNYQVVALVRNPSKISVRSPALTVLQGSPENARDVENAMVGCEAVLVALNNNRTSDLPWAKPVSPPHLIETAVRNIVQAMNKIGVRRIVILSAAGVGDSFPEMPGILRWLIRHTNLGHTYRDHDATDAYIRTTNAQWTLLRPVGLSDADSHKRLLVTYAGNPKAGMTISRSRVARFMLDCLADPALYAKAPLLSQR